MLHDPCDTLYSATSLPKTAPNTNTAPVQLIIKMFIGLGLTDKPIEWLSSRWSHLLIVSLVVTWRSIPFTALVCLAGRQSIPDGLYDGRVSERVILL